MEIEELVNKGYIYMEIPEEWLCLYHKLLHYLADFGENALKDCETSCSGRNKNIIKCWGMFQSALAAKSLGKDKLANTLIKYVEAQLEIIYKGSDKEEFNSGFILPVDEHGFIMALNSCKNNVQFYLHSPLEKIEVVDDIEFKPGHLYVRIANNENMERDFYILESNLYTNDE